MIIVRKFANSKDANDYYIYMGNSADIFKDLSPGSYDAFYISNSNFHLMLNHKSMKEYLEFFRSKLLP
jgi:hypothetical protein